MSDRSQKGDSTNVEGLFNNARFDTEHAIDMYAVSFCTIPAEAIYNTEILAPLMSVIETCHIYFIGYTPKVEFVDAEEKNGYLNLKFKILKNEYMISYAMPLGLSLSRDGDAKFLEDASGEKFWPNEQGMLARLKSISNAMIFDVKYIGQAYGQDGSRNAIDRLLKHETLQRIALKGVPEGYRISLLLFAVEPNPQLFTLFNPFAKNEDAEGSRIDQGLDKLINTTEQEQIALYEAAFIRYFCPEFNKEFKDSFPSTKLKILQDCYEKDFSAVIAEICIDELPFTLKSQSVEPALYHIAKHDLHKDDDRKMFFGF